MNRHKKGFIRVNVSPWEAPVLFVMKNYGTLRLYIDYKDFKQKHYKNKCPLLQMDGLND